MRKLALLSLLLLVILFTAATLFAIGCDWGNSGCPNCSCDAGCCSSDTCSVADCNCVCRGEE